MQDQSAWDMVKQNLASKQMVISLSAARALVLIDSVRAINEIIPELLDRQDWPWANVAHVLQLAGSEQVCQKLSSIILLTTEQKQTSLLRLYNVLRCEEGCHITSEILEHAWEDKVISVCLNISQDPNIIGPAREYADYFRWHVRMNAAVAIGRFGVEDDIPLLVSMMKDKEWWVRYRAAQALVSVPFFNNDLLQELRQTLNDRYANDILSQVLDEIEYVK